LRHSRRVCAGFAVRQSAIVPVKVFAVYAVAQVRVWASSDAYDAASEVQGPAAEESGVSSARLVSAFRDDIDNAVDGIGSPERGAGPPDDFDPFNIFLDDVMNIPEDACEDRGLHGPAVDQYD
jgi:hypothetical protein